MRTNSHGSPALDSAPIIAALVEDDPLLREEVETYLNANGFSVHAVNSASALDDLLSEEAIDLFILDLGLPGESGLSLSRRLRRQMPLSGIVITTARTALNDRITGYQEGGADIYLTKPVDPGELALVLRNLARRMHPEKSLTTWTLSLKDRILLNAETERACKITHREKKFLVALTQAKDNILESWELCDLLVDKEDARPMNKHSLEEFVRRLRKKIESNSGEAAKGALKSVWGLGYQLCISIILK